jgi:hypothetical protein
MATLSDMVGGSKEKKEIPANAHTGKLLKQGELKKLGGSRGGWKTWQSRWFVLRDTGMAYYESEKVGTTSYHPARSLSLSLFVPLPFAPCMCFAGTQT